MRHPAMKHRATAVALLTALVFAGLPATSAAAATVVTVQVTDTAPRGDGSVPYASTGTWLVSSIAGPNAAASRYSDATGATATWTLPAVEEGIYRVEAGVPASSTSETAALYSVSGGRGLPYSVTVDQRSAAANWKPLGWVQLSAGESATVVLSRQATEAKAYTRASAARLVPDENGQVTVPTATGLPYSETWSGGMSGWTALAGSVASWSVQSGEVDAATINNLAASSGTYLRPAGAVGLPETYTLRTSVRIDQLASNGTVTLLTDAEEPYSHVARNTAIQFTPAGIRIARPNGGAALCSGRAPFSTGDFFQLEITRANGILAVRVNSELVATVPAAAAGGTFGIGAYKAAARFGGIGVEELATAPADHPTTASGCDWSPSTDTGAAQPVIINQTGYDLGGPKRFTAPNADDGESFQVVDAAGVIVFTGTVQSRIGDFSALEPASTGPYRILLQGTAGEGESYEFGIGANWTERISYDNAVGFMTDVRCFYGTLAGQALNGTDRQCRLGLGWRDSHQMSFELSALVDLYLANPTPIGAIRMPDAIYSGLQYPTASDSPEIARLIAWGAEIYLRGEYDHALVKEQLASFLWAYPELDQWIPVELYDAVRDYLFPIWDQPAYSRYAWHDYTPHTADLTQVYTQIGTGKGEFPPGHSVVPNLRMWEVAEREGRPDAAVYRDAAIAQVAWLVANLDLTDPLTTKGQRQGEYHLMTALATFGAAVPASDRPAGLADFARAWADVVIQRSTNMWDFRKYSDARWTIPSFTGGASGADPNESGNVLGFPAAALAATTLIADPAVNARLVEIAQAHVDNVFGRNPTGRAAQFRIDDPALAFEGLDLGWFSEYQGGYGLLQGARGVFDGSPKNGHYPFNVGVGNIGHTEGWVTFTTAWLESLAWRAYTSTEVSLDAATAPVDGTVTVTLRAPLNMDSAGDNTGELVVALDGEPVSRLTATQTSVNALDYVAELSIAELNAEPGQTLTVSYGLRSFSRAAELTLTEAGSPTNAPATSISLRTPATLDPTLAIHPTDAKLADASFTAEMGASAAGEWFYAVVDSEPVRLGWFQASSTGRVTTRLPPSLSAGVHVLVLYGATGEPAAYARVLATATDHVALVVPGPPRGGHAPTGGLLLS